MLAAGFMHADLFRISPLRKGVRIVHEGRTLFAGHGNLHRSRTCTSCLARQRSVDSKPVLVMVWHHRNTLLNRRLSALAIDYSPQALNLSSL